MLESWCKLPQVMCLAQCLESSRQEIHSSFLPLCLTQVTGIHLPIASYCLSILYFYPESITKNTCLSLS